MAKNTAGKTVAVSQADIDAFMKAQADAKAEKQAAEAKSKDKAKDGKKRESAFKELAMHNVTVNGGRKFPIGTEGQCIWVGISRFGSDTARVLIDGKDAWIDPKHLTKGKPLAPEKVAAMEAAREIESSKVVMIPASVGQETDKGVLLNYSGWYGPKFFPKSMVSKVGVTAEGLGVFEVPEWKIRKDFGPDSLNTLIAKQEEIIASIVGDETAS